MRSDQVAAIKSQHTGHEAGVVYQGGGGELHLADEAHHSRAGEGLHLQGSAPGGCTAHCVSWFDADLRSDLGGVCSGFQQWNGVDEQEEGSIYFVDDLRFVAR